MSDLVVLRKLVVDARERVEPPVCAVCGKPVFGFAFDNALLLHPGGVRFFAFCHGETEVVHITEEDLQAMVDAGQNTFTFGRAFKPKDNQP
jgi:hypothetical protein